MTWRSFALTLTVVLVFTTGSRHALAYLCSMDGQVHTACCCQRDKAEPRTGQKLEQDDACCKVQVSETAPMPATTKDGAEKGRLPLVLAAETFAPAPEAHHPESHELTLPVGARAPPRAVGPPLYALNCSYLI